MSQYQFGVVGLAVMGRGLALNLAEHGFSVAGYNLEPELTAAFTAEGQRLGFSVTGCPSYEALCSALEKPRKILIMVKAGKPVDYVLDGLLPYLEAGDVVIDGGNSHYPETQARQFRCQQSGIRFLGMGVSGGEEGGGVVSAIRDAEEALYSIRTLGEEMGRLYERLGALRSEAYDIAETVRDLRESFDFSPAELDAVESRSDLLYRLKKKYGATVEEMLSYLDKCRRELDDMETADDTLARLEQQLETARKAVLAAGAELTAARKVAAGELEQRIQSELRDLDMHKVRFAIDFGEKEPGPDGCDAVRFLMSANAGEDLKPIARIASGGELARIMLALKNVLAEGDEIGSLVFDEVDTGVSGRAAQKVAEKMAQVAQHKQVLCVTHLPQIAAMADTHFAVSKGEWGGRTYTALERLDRTRRREELARLIGGASVTPALLESAEELLAQAEQIRKHMVGETQQT